ncbi:MAG: ATP-binding protein, partial [Actinomycetota bacterium]|nr:ATP-binding protein [Actinomycetota bacterium]
VQVLQLFQNLIGNALKFRGDVAPVVHVGCVRERGDWHFSVRDNGIGIDTRDAERIFVLFQRLHSKDAYAGAGIGLALCKKIVDAHQGRIWVESEPGVGATFHWVVPAAIPAHGR